MREHRKRAILFDLDGTLVDSAPDLADALDHVLVQFGYEPVGIHQTRRMIGHGIPKLVEAGLTYRGAVLTPESLGKAVDAFRHYYADHVSVKTRAYPGVEEGLKRLADQGWWMAVCTNKLEAYARHILDDLNLQSFFASVVGPDTFGVAKPDPDHLLKSLPQGWTQAIMVGDSDVDIAAAKAAKLPIIAVSYGYCRVPLESLSPDHIVTQFSDVPAIIARMSDV